MPSVGVGAIVTVARPFEPAPGTGGSARPSCRRWPGVGAARSETINGTNGPLRREGNSAPSLSMPETVVVLGGGANLGGPKLGCCAPSSNTTSDPTPSSAAPWVQSRCGCRRRPFPRRRRSARRRMAQPRRRRHLPTGKLNAIWMMNRRYRASRTTTACASFSNAPSNRNFEDNALPLTSSPPRWPPAASAGSRPGPVVPALSPRPPFRGFPPVVINGESLVDGAVVKTYPSRRPSRKAPDESSCCTSANFNRPPARASTPLEALIQSFSIAATTGSS